MSTKETPARMELFGRETAFRYSESTIGYAIVALRVVIGWALFYPGVKHLTEPGFQQAVAGMTAGAANAAGNPFSPIFAALTGYAGILTPLNA